MQHVKCYCTTHTTSNCQLSHSRLIGPICSRHQRTQLNKRRPPVDFSLMNSRFTHRRHIGRPVGRRTTILGIQIHQHFVPEFDSESRQIVPKLVQAEPTQPPKRIDSKSGGRRRRDGQGAAALEGENPAPFGRDRRMGAVQDACFEGLDGETSVKQRFGGV